MQRTHIYIHTHTHTHTPLRRTSSVEPPFLAAFTWREQCWSESARVRCKCEAQTPRAFGTAARARCWSSGSSLAPLYPWWLSHTIIKQVRAESIHGVEQYARFGLVSLRFSLSRSISLSCSLAFPVRSARAAKIQLYANRMCLACKRAKNSLRAQIMVRRVKYDGLSEQR
jgi:hypothetical protein